MKTKLARLVIGAAMVAAVAATGRAKDAPKELVVGAEHFTVRQITDQRNGEVAFYFQAPKNWKDTSQVQWTLMHITHPVKMAAKIENPANAEGCYVFQDLNCGYLPGPRAAKLEGKDGIDGIDLRPMQPVPALAMFIKNYRGQYPDLKFVGSRDLPDLAKTFNVHQANTQRGVGVKVSYTLDGKPVEEEFYAVHYSAVDQGETLWGLSCVHSFRAPAGTLDKRRNVLAAIRKSFRMTPDFGRRIVMTKQQLSSQYAAKLKQDYAGIAAAGQRSKELTAQDNQFLAGVDAKLAASRAAQNASSSGGGPTRTANDGQDDYIRDVTTMNDPTTGDTTQRSFLQDYHWTDGYSFRDSNDPNFNPNNSEVGNWQLMTPAK